MQVHGSGARNGCGKDLTKPTWTFVVTFFTDPESQGDSERWHRPICEAMSQSVPKKCWVRPRFGGSVPAAVEKSKTERPLRTTAKQWTKGVLSKSRSTTDYETSFTLAFLRRKQTLAVWSWVILDKYFMTFASSDNHLTKCTIAFHFCYCVIWPRKIPRLSYSHVECGRGHGINFGRTWSDGSRRYEKRTFKEIKYRKEQCLI